MERSYDPKRVREYLSSYIEPSAHKDWRDRSKQSLLHIPSVHMDHHCLYALLACTCTTSHCFHWNALGQGLRLRHRKPRRVAAASRLPNTTSSNSKRDVHYSDTRYSLTQCVGGLIYYNEPKAWLLKRKWSEVVT